MKLAIYILVALVASIAAQDIQNLLTKPSDKPGTPPMGAILSDVAQQASHYLCSAVGVACTPQAGNPTPSSSLTPGSTSNNASPPESLAFPPLPPATPPSTSVSPGSSSSGSTGNNASPPGSLAFPPLPPATPPSTSVSPGSNSSGIVVSAAVANLTASLQTQISFLSAFTSSNMSSSANASTLMAASQRIAQLVSRLNSSLVTLGDFQAPTPLSSGRRLQQINPYNVRGIGPSIIQEVGTAGSATLTALQTLQMTINSNVQTWNQSSDNAASTLSNGLQQVAQDLGAVNNSIQSVIVRPRTAEYLMALRTVALGVEERAEDMVSPVINNFTVLFNAVNVSRFTTEYQNNALDVGSQISSIIEGIFAQSQQSLSDNVADLQKLRSRLQGQSSPFLDIVQATQQVVATLQPSVAFPIPSGVSSLIANYDDIGTEDANGIDSRLAACLDVSQLATSTSPLAAAIISTGQLLSAFPPAVTSGDLQNLARVINEDYDYSTDIINGITTLARVSQGLDPNIVFGPSFFPTLSDLISSIARALNTPEALSGVSNAFFELSLLADADLFNPSSLETFGQILANLSGFETGSNNSNYLTATASILENVASYSDIVDSSLPDALGSTVSNILSRNDLGSDLLGNVSTFLTDISESGGPKPLALINGTATYLSGFATNLDGFSPELLQDVGKLYSGFNNLGDATLTFNHLSSVLRDIGNTPDFPGQGLLDVANVFDQLSLKNFSIQGEINQAISYLKGQVSDAVEDLVDSLGDTLTDVAEGDLSVTDAAGEVLGNIGETVIELGDTIVGDLAGLADTVGSLVAEVGDLVDGLAAGLTSIIDAISTGALADTLTDLGAIILDNLPDLLLLLFA